MKITDIISISIAVVLLAGCSTTRSISNSGYETKPASPAFCPPVTSPDPAFDYQGELSEFDVLGISRNQFATEADIGRALDTAKRIKLRTGSSVLLIQSGAEYPDGVMVSELGKHFTVVPFSGVPPFRKSYRGHTTESVDPESYSRSLRLAAARGGNDTILCYWGILESANQKLPTKTISWVPGLNWMLPDEKQYMRIRLKLAVVDVRTGDWAMLSPKTFDDGRISISPRRAVTDQKLVEGLKEKAYAAAAKDLVERYAEVAVK